jgi:xanthine dehydrogenase accessory factor
MSWLAPLRDWPTTAIQALQANSAVVRVVVATVRGSAPRETGACMLIDSQHVFGTIGGGNLEHVAIQSARRMLDAIDAAAVSCEHFVLATHLAQCCGGVVDVWFERYRRDDLPVLNAIRDGLRRGGESLEVDCIDGYVTRRVVPGVLEKRIARGELRITWQEPLRDARPQVWVFGAGHVGQALVRTLAMLPVAVTWIDSRADMLPMELPEVTSTLTADPVTLVDSAPAGTHFVVMTHDHALDYALCREILARRTAATVGVIGSLSKAARFRSRLARDGFDPAAIASLRCPIGIDGVRSKEPAAIAIAVAAQLLRDIDASAYAQHSHESLTVHCVVERNGGCATCVGVKVAS